MLRCSLIQRSLFTRIDSWASTSIDLLARYMPSPFLSLTAHALFWPTLAWNYLVCQTTDYRWYDEITVAGKGRLILGAYPWPHSVVERLENSEKVNLVINTVAEKRNLTFSSNVEIVNVPMRDFAEPSVRDILNCVAEIDKAMTRGKTVYVHCKAGKGRSATAVLCWLVMKKGLTVDEAQALLETRRPQVLETLRFRKSVIEAISTK